MKTADFCCHGNCREGRDCPLAPMPTRRAIWLEQKDGGQTVDTDDAPHPWWFYVLAAVAVVAVFGSPAFFI